MSEEMLSEEAAKVKEALDKLNFKIGYKMELEEPLENKDGEILLDHLEFKNKLTALAIEDLPADFLQGEMGKYPLKTWKPLICHMTGKGAAIINKLGVADYNEAVGVCLYFLVSGPKTGK